MAKRISEYTAAPDLERADKAIIDEFSSGFTRRVELGQIADFATAHAGGVSLKAFGAVGDGVTDDSQAVRDAIAAAGAATGAGRVFVPAGTYLLASTVAVEFNILFEGEGSTFLTNGRASVFLAAAGVTAFKVRKGPVGYGTGTKFQNVEIAAQGKNATTTTGTISAGSNVLTLAAAADFADGDVILVRGAGHKRRLQQEYYNYASTMAGSATFTMTRDAGLYPGMVLEIEGAGFPAGAYVVSKVANEEVFDVTLSATAASTVTGARILFQDDFAAEILSGGGTTALTLSRPALTAATGAEVLHYDCGVFATDTFFGTHSVYRGFQGAGVCILAGDDVVGPYGVNVDTNANEWALIGCILRENRNGLRLYGEDTNAGGTVLCHISVNTEYSYVDASFLGNYNFALHTAGLYGWMTLVDVAGTVIDPSYTEGGTIHTLAANTRAGNGAAGNAFGGVGVSTQPNALYQSPTVFGPNWHDVRLTVGSGINPVSGNLMTIDASGLGGSAFTRFQRTLATNGQAGLWGWMVGGDPGGAALLFSDTDAEKGKGHAYMLRGAYIGRDQGTVTQGNFRRWFGGAAAAPVSGDFTQGDAFVNHSMFVGQSPIFVCIGSGTPGTWRGLAQIPTIDGGVNLPEFTVATLPPAVSNNRAAVICTDGDAGAKCMAVSDGAAWQIVRFQGPVSAA